MDQLEQMIALLEHVDTEYGDRLTKVIASLVRKVYNSLIAEGFSPEQALTLTTPIAQNLNQNNK